MKNEKSECRVIWSEEDREYVGLCDRFPSLSWLAATREAALTGIRHLVRDAVLDIAPTTPNRPLADVFASLRGSVKLPKGVTVKDLIERGGAG